MLGGLKEGATAAYTADSSPRADPSELELRPQYQAEGHVCCVPGLEGNTTSVLLCFADLVKHRKLPRASVTSERKFMLHIWASLQEKPYTECLTLRVSDSEILIHY